MDFLAVHNSSCIPVEPTVGCRPAGFGGLAWNKAISRWIQAQEAPDLDLPDVLRHSIPLFVLAIIGEVIHDYVTSGKVYTLRQGWTNVGTAATMFFIWGIALRGLVVFPYLVVHHYCAIYRGYGILAHLTAFVGIDLAAYLGHSWVHSANLGWSAHNMHHSSPDYNLLVAIRQGSDFYMAFLFYLPLAFVVPLRLFFLFYGINYSYQFFVHTPFIKKLPDIVEFFMVTPRHHRVYHARNYPKGNYGGMLIIWDRMFGTFIPFDDDKPCIYGLDERQIPLGTHNPIWQQTHHYWYTFKGFFHAKGINRLKILFTRKHVKGMVAPKITDSEADSVPLPPNGVATDTRISSTDAYVGVHGVLCFLVAFYTFRKAAYAPPLQLLATCVNLLLSFTTVFSLMDEKNTISATRNEILRLIIVAMTGFWALEQQLAVALAICCMISSMMAYELRLMGKSHMEKGHPKINNI